MLLRSEARKPFIPKNNGDPQFFFKLPCKYADFLALAALFSTHVQRLTDYNLVHLVYLCKSPKKFNVGFGIFSLDCGPRLCCQEKSVADGDADGFIAHVEGHNPHNFMIQPVVCRAIMKRRLTVSRP